MSADTPQKGQLRVWWIPQMGAPIPQFTHPVPGPETAIILLDALAFYDLFQLEHNIKPDYSNMGGLEVFNGDEWEEWENDDGDSITDVMRERELAAEEARL